MFEDRTMPSSSHVSVDPDLTPRASQDHIDRNETRQATKTNDAFTNLPEDDAISTVTRSTRNSYAPSSIIEHRALLSGRRRSSVEHRLQKTKGRKNFERACSAVDIFIPLDINDEATSMQNNSLAKLARAAHRRAKSLAHDTDMRIAGQTSKWSSKEPESIELAPYSGDSRLSSAEGTSSALPTTILGTQRRSTTAPTA